MTEQVPPPTGSGLAAAANGDASPRAARADRVRIRSVRAGTGRDVSLVDLGTVLSEAGARVWVDLVAPSGEELAGVAAVLGLHPLVAQTINEPVQRPRLQRPA